MLDYIRLYDIIIYKSYYSLVNTLIPAFNKSKFPFKMKAINVNRKILIIVEIIITITRKKIYFLVCIIFLYFYLGRFPL